MAQMVHRAGSPIAARLGVGAVGTVALGGVVARLLFDARPRDPLVIAAIGTIV